MKRKRRELLGVWEKVLIHQEMLAAMMMRKDRLGAVAYGKSDATMNKARLWKLIRLSPFYSSRLK